MDRIAQCTEKARASQRKLLIPYIVAGDPGPELTVPALHAMVEAGADIIELGVPFSDPMAEGPVIQKGHERALAHRVSLRQVLAMVAEFRQRDDSTPVVLMGYANPVERMGYAEFAEAACAAGVDGILTVDLPPEEAEPLQLHLRDKGLHNIFLLAPTTTEERIQAVVKLASGYLYYVSLKGVTGAGHLDVEDVAARLAVIGGYSQLPICVGFGVKDADSARCVADLSDGAVVGSALVKILGESELDGQQRLEQLSAFVAQLRAGLDQ